MLRLLELAEQSEGVRIFIGAESGLFGTSGRVDGGRARRATTAAGSSAPSG